MARYLPHPSLHDMISVICINDVNVISCGDVSYLGCPLEYSLDYSVVTRFYLPLQFS